MGNVIETDTTRMLRSRAMQMIHQPGTWFHLELTIESAGKSGTQQTEIPQKFRSEFTFHGKEESGLGDPWHAYEWEATLSQQDLIAFLQARFLPLGQVPWLNDYEEYEECLLTGPDGNEYITVSMRIMHQFPKPIWLEITPDSKHCEPGVLQMISIRPEEYLEIMRKR